MIPSGAKLMVSHLVIIMLMDNMKNAMELNPHHLAKNNASLDIPNNILMINGMHHQFTLFLLMWLKSKLKL